MRRRMVTACGAAVLVIGAAALFVAYPHIAEPVCEALDGKWGSNGNICITRACYQDHSCGHWTHPAGRCNRLKPGDSIAEVYFQLGEPDRVENGRHLWLAGKMLTPTLVATFTQERLASLSVEANPAYPQEANEISRACVIGPQR